MWVDWQDIKVMSEDSYSQEGYSAYSVENTGTLAVTLKDFTTLSPGQERVFPYFPGHFYKGSVQLTWASGAGTKSITLKVFKTSC